MGVVVTEGSENRIVVSPVPFGSFGLVGEPKVAEISPRQLVVLWASLPYRPRKVRQKRTTRRGFDGWKIR